jgi:hypothetical protein
MGMGRGWRTADEGAGGGMVQEAAIRTVGVQINHGADMRL